jgi:hypothetical protein
MQFHCEKKRRIIRRERDGTQRELFRCSNTLAKDYGKEVGEEACKNCVLRVAGLTTIYPLCGQQPPLEPIYKQPIFGPNCEIIYTEQIDVMTPECPEGYHTSDANSWVFISDWVPCPKRVFTNTLSSSGELKVKATCSLLKQSVTCGDCNECGAKLETMAIDAPDYPELQLQIYSYWESIKRWLAAKRPVRTEDEVKKIHADYCSKCEWYDEQSQRCRGCGCKVRPQGLAVFNKIRMATENCPQKLW